MATTLAFELAAGGDLVGFAATTLRANRLTIGFSPTHFAERVVCGFLTSFVDGAKAQGASGGGKEEMLGHDALLSLLM